MSKKEVVLPKFRMPYGELKQLADSTQLLIDRDIAEFNDRGFTPDKRVAFQTAIDAFYNFPTDEQMEGRQMAATDARFKARDVLESKMRSIFQAVATVFGEKSATYRSFGKSNLTKQKDDELIRSAKEMIAEISEHLADLAEEGITLAKAAQLETAKNTLDAAIDAQRKAVKNRDKATETRVNLGNELYSLVAKYNEIGKDIWYAASEAKYNDYIIYDTPAKPSDKTDKLSEV